ncbi:hypothetical protein COL922a_010607, partial [Colletotrichum nupharicola]
ARGKLSGTNAEQSRYNEGGAEFWSLTLLWRAGMLNTDQYLNEMNTRAVDYYTNPTVNFTDEKAQDVAWEIREAQRIPYGRGMLHFANIDAQTRAKYNGTQKLDNLAIPFLHTCQQSGNCGAEEWFPLLKSSLGQEAVDDWNKVSSGQPLIKPVEGSLGPCFEVAQNGTSPVVYVWKVKEGLNTSNSDCLI